MFKWLYNKMSPAHTEPVYTNQASQDAAKAAIIHADTGYDHVIANSEKVDEVVSKLRYQKERNHFAYLIERTMKGVG